MHPKEEGALTALFPRRPKHNVSIEIQSSLDPSVTEAIDLRPDWAPFRSSLGVYGQTSLIEREVLQLGAYSVPSTKWRSRIPAPAC
jgi:hypothetical protein